jgi:hypothetical protein
MVAIMFWFRNICVKEYYGYIPCVIVTIPPFFTRLWLIVVQLIRVIRWIQLVKKLVHPASFRSGFLVMFVLFTVPNITCLNEFSSVLWFPRNKRCSCRLYCHLVCWRFKLYLSYLYLFTYSDVQYEFPFKWCWWRLAVTQVERNCFSFPSTCMSPFPFFSGVRVDWSVFFSILYFIIDCLPIFFLLTFVLFGIIFIS